MTLTFARTVLTRYSPDVKLKEGCSWKEGEGAESRNEKQSEKTNVNLCGKLWMQRMLSPCRSIKKNETDLAAAARQPVQSHLNDDVGGKEKKGSNS